MTDKDLFDDLKQFITATVSQQLADVASKDDIAALKSDIGGINKRLDAVDKRFDDTDLKLDAIQQAIGKAVERIETASRVDRATLDDHGHRIHRLEQRSA